MLRRPLCSALLLLALVVVPSARAATNVVVQGTTDIKDSGLAGDVLVPGFHKAFPQYDLTFVAVGTGQALTNARAGQGDAVVTHAPKQEALFVKDGYSAEPFGRAVFYSDYVILGPKSDPAGVASGAPHDAARAFELIAAKAAAGGAKFVSRGDDSGTNTEEHTIWALTNGVSLCTYPTAKGGGKEPSTTSGACNADSTLRTPPVWYIRTGAGQAQTVLTANQCPPAGSDSKVDCYEMTDRGTYNRLVSENQVGNLKVVSQNNAAGARGGPNLLINSFHAYAVNPAKFAPGTIDTAGAQAFLNYLTSPALQKRLATYPSAAQQAFFADATPSVTFNKLPKVLTAGQKLTVKGSIANNVPGAPVLNNVAVALSRISGGKQVGQDSTSKTGKYSIRFTPTRTTAYSVGTPPITKLEIGGVGGTPSFSDQLTAGSTRIKTVVRLRAKVKITKTTAAFRQAVVTGTSAPASDRRRPTLTIVGRRGGKTRVLRKVKLPTRGKLFVVPVNLGSGAWRLTARYADKGIVTSTVSRRVARRVGKTNPVRLTKLSGTNGALRLSGLVASAPSGSGATVQVFARSTTTGRFHRIRTIRLRSGQTTFSAAIKRKAQRYSVELKYLNGGSSYSRVGSVKVRAGHKQQG